MSRLGWLPLLMMAAPALAQQAAAPAAKPAPASKPVVLERMIFDGQPSDYAGGWARIVGLKKNGDGFVSVRAAPSTDATEVDRRTLNRNVYAINPADDWKKATFIGVIYHPDPNADAEKFEAACGVENPPRADAPVKREYTGPCKSGWVHKRFVEVLAD